MIRDKLELSDRVALVVGGRRFLGRRFCAALAEFGQIPLMLTYRSFLWQLSMTHPRCLLKGYCSWT